MWLHPFSKCTFVFICLLWWSLAPVHASHVNTSKTTENWHPKPHLCSLQPLRPCLSSNFISNLLDKDFCTYFLICLFSFLFRLHWSIKCWKVHVSVLQNSVKEKVTRGELACCKPSSDGFVQIGTQPSLISCFLSFLFCHSFVRFCINTCRWSAITCLSVNYEFQVLYVILWCIIKNYVMILVRW